MSLVEVTVPQLSESVAEATLLQWKKPAGAAVAADEILVEIETDKVVLEVPAPAPGSLAEIVVGDGSNVVSGQVIARIDTAASAKVAASPPAAAGASAAKAATPPPPPPAAPAGRRRGVRRDGQGGDARCRPIARRGGHERDPGHGNRARRADHERR